MSECSSVCMCYWKDLRGDPRLQGLIIDDELRLDNISRLWDDFNRALSDKNAKISDRLARSVFKVNRLRPVESHSGARGNILMGPQTFSWGPSWELKKFFFQDAAFWCIFVFLSGAWGSLPTFLTRLNLPYVVMRSFMFLLCFFLIFFLFSVFYLIPESGPRSKLRLRGRN